jgi:hypothetical protein
MAKKAKKAKKYVIPKGLATFTLQMPKDMHKRIKARRAKTGESMKDFMINAAEKALKRAA